jgi:hypothetical protein
MVSRGPLGMTQRHFPTPCLPVTTSGLCGYNILPAHTVSLQGHQAVAPRKFPMSHDHPSEVPSSRSTWEETINPQLQIESSGFGFRSSKAFHLKLKIHLNLTSLFTYSLPEKKPSVLHQTMVSGSPLEMPQKSTMSDTFFTSHCQSSIISVIYWQLVL